MCSQYGAGECKGYDGCAALEHSMQYCTPLYSTHVGWTHNTITIIAHIPSIVPEPMGDMVKLSINHIVWLGV